MRHPSGAAPIASVVVAAILLAGTTWGAAAQGGLPGVPTRLFDPATGQARNTATAQASKPSLAQAGKTTTGQPGSENTPEKLNLTPTQKHQISQNLASEHKQAVPPNLKIAAGADLPSTVTLSPVPLEVSNDIPATKNLSYARLENKEILLVDPKDRKIAEVIRPQTSTTGSGAAN